MEDQDHISRNRMVLLSIVGIPLTMILAATWLWYFVVRGDLDLVGALGTANQGSLVQPPRQIDELDLFDQGGFEFSYAELEPRWTMLVVSQGGRCDATCEHSLYVIRQIHVALGKEFNRIQRMYIGEEAAEKTALEVVELSDNRPAPASLAELVEDEHRGLKALRLDSDGIDGAFPERADAPDTWYLVDPGGWIMMSYRDEIPYKGVISDLKFLLKNSSE